MLAKKLQELIDCKERNAKRKKKAEGSSNGGPRAAAVSRALFSSPQAKKTRRDDTNDAQPKQNKTVGRFKTLVFLDLEASGLSGAGASRSVETMDCRVMHYLKRTSLISDPASLNCP